MRRKAIALLTAALAALAAPALGEELPSVACFSPGLIAMSEAMGEGAGLTVTAQFEAEEALFARDISILSDMLEGTVFTYAGAPGHDSLTIARGGQTLCALALDEGEGHAVATVNGEAYALDDALTQSDALARAQAADAFLRGTPILERAPLDDVAAWLEGLAQGEALIAGYAVAQPFTVAYTMSDDGTRLTRIQIDGQIAREGEAPWRVTGFLRQPAGRAPKDTFELEFRQDEQNFIELSYSALRESETIRKGREGEVSVSSTLRAAGELQGYGLSARLIVKATNHWSTQGEGAPLEETITLRTTVGYTDRRPQSANANRDDLAATLRHTLRLTGAQGGAMPGLIGEASAEVTLGGQALLAGSMTMDVSCTRDAQAQAAATPGEAAQGAGLTQLRAAIERAVERMSAGLHAQLSGEEAYRQKIAP